MIRVKWRRSMLSPDRYGRVITWLTGHRWLSNALLLGARVAPSRVQPSAGILVTWAEFGLTFAAYDDMRWRERFG